MPTADELIIKVTGDVGGFKNAADNVSTGLNNMATKVQDFGIKFGLMMNGLKIAAGYVNDLVGAYQKQEVAEAKLTAAMKNVRTASKDAADQLKEQAKALQSLTTFGDEEVMSAQAMLGTFQLNEKQIMAITPRLLDMAAASQKAGMADADLQSIAIALGKGFTGQTGMLSRYGIVLDDAAVKAYGFEGIIKSLDDNFKGMAETIAQTSAGSMKQFQNVLGDMKEEFGKTISVGLVPFLKPLKDLLETFNALPDIMKRIITSLGLLGVAFAAFVKVMNVSMAQAGMLTAAMAALAAGIWAVNKMLDAYRELQVAALKEKNLAAYTNSVNNMNKASKLAKDEMKKLEEQGLKNSDRYKQLENNVRKYTERKKELIGESKKLTTEINPAEIEQIKNALIPSTEKAKEVTKDYSDEVKGLTIIVPQLKYKIKELSGEFKTDYVKAIKHAGSVLDVWDKQTMGNIRRVLNFVDSGFSRMANVMVDKMNGVKITWANVFVDILHSFEKMVMQMLAKAALLGALEFFFGGATGGFGFLIKKVAGLAEGGLIKRAQAGLLVNSPTLVYAGEGGESEAVVPFSKLINVLQAVVPPINISTSDPNIAVDYYANWPRAAQDRFVREVVQPAIERELKR